MSLYFPVIFLSRHPEHASPVDALAALDVPAAEALECALAYWHGRSAEEGQDEIILAWLDGGRAVAALRLGGQGWIPCNAYPESASSRRIEAERALAKIARRGKKGCVACVPAGFFDGESGSQGDPVS
ncbi:MAG: hypothetical protein FWD77_11355 [Betaproteobacteria bacterium]|nr:hypothetical protein [Betaproteobacteria bacterium]